MHELFQLSTYAVKKASDVILKYYNSSYEVQMKGKGNPVTEADIEADDILKEILIQETPDFGWLSEETRDSKKRLEKLESAVETRWAERKPLIKSIQDDQAKIDTLESKKAASGLSDIEEKQLVDLKEKQTPELVSSNLIPWFAAPFRTKINCSIVFGHWSTLVLSPGEKQKYKVYPVDTGAVWRGTLTAIRIEDLKHFSTCPKTTG